MSKHHQASRRRSYGRRQHELHERVERPDPRTDNLGNVHDDAGLIVDEPRYRSLRWSVAAWGGLR